MLKRPDVLVVLGVRFLVAGQSGFGLGVKPLLLVNRVNQLRVGFEDLPAVDDQLELINDRRILVITPRQRRNVNRLLGNQRRLDNFITRDRLVQRVD